VLQFLILLSLHPRLHNFSVHCFKWRGSRCLLLVVIVSGHGGRIYRWLRKTAG
jgi:hypothetical protein